MMCWMEIRILKKVTPLVPQLMSLHYIVELDTIKKKKSKSMVIACFSLHCIDLLGRAPKRIVVKRMEKFFSF